MTDGPYSHVIRRGDKITVEAFGVIAEMGVVENIEVEDFTSIMRDITTSRDRVRTFQQASYSATLKIRVAVYS